jgi:hypothetical protein
MNSAAHLEAAHDGFVSAGLGVVVTFDDQEGVRYSTLEGLRGALVEAPELEGLFAVSAEVVATYDPDRKAAGSLGMQRTMSAHGLDRPWWRRSEDNRP